MATFAHAGPAARPQAFATAGARLAAPRHAAPRLAAPHGNTLGSGLRLAARPAPRAQRADSLRPMARAGGREAVEDDGFSERVVQVRRVTKVVKGGKQLSFRAVVSRLCGRARGPRAASLRPIRSHSRAPRRHLHLRR